jgi:hypothetical protein
MRGGWVTVPARIDALVGQADILREWNRLSEADFLLREGPGARSTVRTAGQYDKGSELSRAWQAPRQPADPGGIRGAVARDG